MKGENFHYVQEWPEASDPPDFSPYLERRLRSLSNYYSDLLQEFRIARIAARRTFLAERLNQVEAELRDRGIQVETGVEYDRRRTRFERRKADRRGFERRSGERRRVDRRGEAGVSPQRRGERRAEDRRQEGRRLGERRGHDRRAADRRAA